MGPRSILKSPRVFPLEHEQEPRTRSRSRDRRHADEALQLVGPLPPTTAPRRTRPRHRSHSRSRRVRWTDPVEIVIHDGQDLLPRELRHRRSSLPGILEDTRTTFKESLREQENREEAKAPTPSQTPTSSSRKRPALKSTLSTPDVGRASQPANNAQIQVHTPTPISSEHRRRRSSLPNGLEAAVKSSSHALWLPHPGDQQPNDHPTPPGPSPPRANELPTPHHRRTGSHSSHRSNGHVSLTPRHYEPAPLPPHAHEQPNFRGRGLPPPPPVTFTQSPLSRPPSQLVASTQRSPKSSRKRSPPLALTAPPEPSPKPSVKQVSPPLFPKQPSEPATPRSVKSSLISFPTVDDAFSKEDTHSKLSIRRLFGLSTPKHEPRKLDDERLSNKSTKKEPWRPGEELEHERQRTSSNSFLVHPPPREPLHRARHSFDLGTFSLLDDMHMRWTAATARHFLPVLSLAEIEASHQTLHLNPSLASVHWDIRHPPTAVWSVLPGRKTTLWQEHREPATIPLVPVLRIMSPYFPWAITARNPNGVTCGDVLSAVHTNIRQLVWRGDFDQLHAPDKDRLAAGYYANRPARGEQQSADAPFEANSWLVRADWLGRYTVLRGMSANVARDRYGQPSDVLLTMYLVENRRAAEPLPVVVRP